MNLLKTAFLILLALLSISTRSFSQNKVKYKNLYPILQSKDYTKAEPLLIALLRENDDEANAYFYYGEILSGRLDSTAFLHKRATYDSIADLAISSYQKATALIDDRELRKNDEYYMAYNRRDLRTGKFGIKLSDVHLDYENKIATVSSKKEKVQKIYDKKEGLQSQVNVLNSKVSQLLEQFTDEKAFYFRSSSKEHELVGNIKNEYAQFEEALNAYIAAINSLNNAQHTANKEVKTIENWSELTPLDVNFSTASFLIADLGSYTEVLLSTIKEEILPLKELLTTVDQQLDQAILTNKSLKDSTDISFVNIPALLSEKMFALDNRSLPLEVLQYKMLKSEAEILSNTNLRPVLADSANIYQRFSALDFYLLKLKEMEAMLQLISKRQTDEVLKDYSFYFGLFEPSFKAYLDTEELIVETLLKSVSDDYSSVKKAREKFLWEQSPIYLIREVAALNGASDAVDTVLNEQQKLILGGRFHQQPFVAKAGFDMKIEILIAFDSTFIFEKIIMLQPNFLAVLTASSETVNETLQMIVYLDQDMKEIWRHEFSSQAIVSSAKVEAGIFFLYGEDGTVLQTLDATGKVIGG